jgi:hypothetical protein
MGDYSEPVAEEPRAADDLSHRRILTIMALLVVAGCILGVILASGRFGIGVLLGGILSFVNYYWLKASLKTIFERAAVGDKPRFLAAKYFLRYLALGLILVFLYFAVSIPVTAMILGLASFVFAVVIEGILRIFTTSYK